MIRNYSSSDSEDSLPLVALKHEDTNSYSSLCAPSLEYCEFCDKQFDNRISQIIHNASHIVIPLIKQSFHQCNECLHHFSSLEELSAHTIKHHPSQESSIHTKIPEILRSIVEKHVVVKCQDELRGLTTIGCAKNKIESELNPNKGNTKMVVTIVEISSDEDCSPNSRVKEESPESIIRNPVNESHSPERVIHSPQTSLYSPKWDEDQETNLGTPIIQNGLGKKLKSPERELQSSWEQLSTYICPDLNPEGDEDSISLTFKQNDSNSQSQLSLDFNSSPARDQSSPVDYSPKREFSLDRDQFSPEKDEFKINLFSPKYFCEPPVEIKQELSSPDHEPIRSRIRFEDDDDDLFLTEEKLAPNLYKIFQANSYQNKGATNNSDVFPPSIHYDQLIEDVLSTCKSCGLRFRNRLELIKHEATHLRLRRTRFVLCSVCENYYSGNYHNLRRHIQSQHPDSKHKTFTTQNCQVCHLKYHNYARHHKKYHQIYKCVTCDRYYDKNELKSHNCDDCELSVKKGDSSVNNDFSVKMGDLSVKKGDLYAPFRIVNMCDLCLTLARNKERLRVVGEKCEQGLLQKCYKCEKEFFTINIVRAKPWSYKKKDFFAEPKKREWKKPLSNQDRLASIQKRLKMINKLSRFYVLSFYLTLVEIMDFGR